MRQGRSLPNPGVLQSGSVEVEHDLGQYPSPNVSSSKIFSKGVLRDSRMQKMSPTLASPDIVVLQSFLAIEQRRQENMSGNGTHWQAAEHWLLSLSFVQSEPRASMRGRLHCNKPGCRNRPYTSESWLARYFLNLVQVHLVLAVPAPLIESRDACSLRHIVIR